MSTLDLRSSKLLQLIQYFVLVALCFVMLLSRGLNFVYLRVCVRVYVCVRERVIACLYIIGRPSRMTDVFLQGKEKIKMAA